MTSSELRQMADKAEREGLTEAELLMVTQDIIQTHLTNQDESLKLRSEVDRMSDIYNRRMPQLMERCLQAEAVAGFLLELLKQYMTDEDIGEAIVKRAAEATREGMM